MNTETTPTEFPPLPLRHPLQREISLTNSINSLPPNVTITSPSFSGVTTDNIPEGSNLYYTDARVQAVLAASSTLGTTFSANNWKTLNLFSAGASTTQLSAYNGIYVGDTATTTILGSATSTFGAGINATLLNITSTTATSTFANGINVTKGCFALNNNCLTLGTFSGTLAVGSGGTGSTTLSGILKGNGTSQIATAIGGTDYEFPLTFNSGVTRSGNTISLDLTRANSWSALQLFSAGASSTNFSNFGTAYFGGTATTTIDNAGNVVVGGALTASGNVTFGNATTTSLFSTTASSTNLFAQTASLGSLTLASPLAVASGGTGWSSLASGSIPFGNGSLALATSSSLFWDNTNGRLGIGTTSPATTFAVGGSGYFTGGLGVGTRNTSSGTLQTSGNATIGGTLQAAFLTTPGGTQTLSGSQAPTLLIKSLGNWAGSTSLNGSTNIIYNKISSASDALAASNGEAAQLWVNDNLANGWDGSRLGVYATLNPTATTSLTNGGYMVAMKGQSASNFNLGGTATGFGTSSFGEGSLFGNNFVAWLQGGGTYYSQVVGSEIDVEADAGSSVSREAGLQIVHQGNHAVQGTTISTGLLMADQISASAGWRNVFTVGDYNAQFPVDPNGYIFQVQNGVNYQSVPANAAGGIDLLQGNFNGSGNVGGGFAFRSQGFSIDNSGAAQIGYGYLSSTSTGLSIDVPEYQMTGTPTVQSGGSNFTTGDLAGDAYGDVVTVTAPAGSVSSVTVVRRGWTKAAPSNPISFTALNRQGGSFGAGLTLNETWTSQNSLILNASGGNVGIGTSTPGSIFSVNGVANWSAATSTYYSSGGINLSGGCFAVGGNCLSLSSLSGTIGVASGGTGSTTLTGLLKGNGTGSILSAVSGTDYQAPITAGTGLSFTGNTLNSFWTLNSSNNLYNNNSGSEVGVGTTSPYALLSIAGSAGGTTPLMSLSTSTSAFATSTALLIDQLGNVYLPNAYQKFAIGSTNVSGTGNDALTIANAGGNANEAIVAGGAVSGSTAAGALIDLVGYTGATTVKGRFTASNGGTVSIGSITNHSFTFTTNNVEVGRFTTGGNFGIGTTTPWAKLSLAGAAGGTIPLFAISTSTSGFSTSTALFIDQNGNVGIGTTSPSTVLQIAGSITPNTDNAFSSGNATYRWSAVYAANGTVQTSDERLKENIATTTYGLTEILKLNPVSFTWKAQPQQGKQLGFLAQEVQPIMPEIVNVGDDANHTLGLTYTEFIPIIARIQLTSA